MLPRGAPDLRVLRALLPDEPWVEAVASSLTELFAPKIHQQRIEAFPHCPWIPPEALDYWRGRLVQAPRDVRHGLSIVQQHCTTVDTQLGRSARWRSSWRCCGR